MVDIDFEVEAQILKALAHPTRLRIIEILQQEPICVKHIGGLMDVPQANLSQHLSILRNCGIVSCSRDGNRICYSIRDSRAAHIIAVLKNHAFDQSV